MLMWVASIVEEFYECSFFVVLFLVLKLRQSSKIKVFHNSIYKCAYRDSMYNNVVLAFVVRKNWNSNISFESY